MTVLSAINPQSFGNTLLLLQLDRNNAQKVQREQKNVSDTISRQVNSVNQKADKYRDLKEDIRKAINFIDRLVSRGDNIKNLLDKMATITFKANYGIPLSFPGYSNSFDSYLRRFNIEAEDMGINPNLLGSASQVKYSYAYKINGATKTLSPTFVGSDYTIKESGDYIWRRDRDLGQLRRFVDSTGAYTGTYVGLSSSNIQLDSFTAADDTVTFTTAFGTAAATQYSGTITRSGVKVLDGWLYAGLSTADGRTRAEDDLHDAEDILLGVISAFKSAQTAASFYDDQIDIKLAGFNDLIEEKTAAGLVEMKAAEVDSFRLNNINTALVSSAMSVRGLYLEAISLGKNTDLTKALVNLVA